MTEEYGHISDAFDMLPYPDAMFEEAERREKLNAGFKQDADGNWYRPTLQELTRKNLGLSTKRFGRKTHNNLMTYEHSICCCGWYCLYCFYC